MLHIDTLNKRKFRGSTIKPITKTTLASALSLLLVQAPFTIAETENKENEQPSEEVETTEEAVTDKETANDDNENDTADTEEKKFSVEAALAIAGIAGAIASGSKSSSSGLSNGDYRNTVEGNFLTEYNYQSMLSSINPLSLNDYGYDGTGINVAVVDSGIDSSHSEFDGKTIQGYDFASSATGYGSDENGHGTHVASIIAGERDAVGMRGVAYDANLFDYKTDNNGDSTFEAINSDASIAAIFNRHVTDNIRVSNNSWGGSTLVDQVSTAYVTSANAQTITAIKAAQANGALIIFAAGNAGAFQPALTGALPYHDTDLKDAWLVVAAVGSNLKETLYTNRCGVAYDFCVTAPGGGDAQSTDGILAAEANTGGYVRYSGTSMATPHVSGLAAALMEKFPTLTPGQIATRIKTTASLANLTGYNGQTLASNGEATMRAIFGYGLVNTTAASSSIGSLVFPAGSNTANGTLSKSSSLALPAAISGHVTDTILKDTFIVFDTFDGATFSVTGDQLFKGQTSAFTPSYKITPTASDLDDKSNNMSDISFAFVEADNSTIAPDIWGAKSNFFGHAPFVVATPKQNVSWSTSYAGLSFSSFLSADLAGQNNLVFSQTGASVLIPASSDLDISVAFATGDTTTDLGYFKSGITQTATNDFELGAHFTISPTKRLFGRYSRTDYDDIRTTATAFGTSNLSADSINVGYEVISEDSAMTIGLKSDFTLVDGSLNMAVPVAVNADGDVIAYEKRNYMVSAQRTYDPYLSYAGKVSDEVSWVFSGHLDASDNYDVGEIKLAISSQF